MPINTNKGKREGKEAQSLAKAMPPAWEQPGDRLWGTGYRKARDPFVRDGRVWSAHGTTIAENKFKLAMIQFKIFSAVRSHPLPLREPRIIPEVDAVSWPR